MQSEIINLSVLVRAEWDDEAGVWVATSEDVPGLVAEHGDFRALQTMVLELVPVLLAENGMIPQPHGSFDIPVHIAANALARGKALVSA